MTVTIKTPRKKAILGLTLVIILVIVLIGTFAWNSFNQSRINVFNELISHDVNLHDDFDGGPNKDVYVENSGKFPIFVRIKLTEYLETINRGSLLKNSVRGENDEGDALAFARDTWAPHNGYDHKPYEFPSAQTDAAITRPPEGEFWALGDLWPADEYFPDYYTWIMGGSGGTANSWVYYRPATEEQKGQYDEAGNPIEGGEPQVVVDYEGMELAMEALGIADAHAYYKTLVDAEMATNGSDEALALETLGLKKSLGTTAVVTMDAWLDDGFSPKTGKFWVVDKDGWCYWAEPLNGGDATGLLLDKVDRTSKLFDSNAEYAINVWLQAVDESELTDMLSMEANGGSTDDAKKLMNIAAGRITLIGQNTYVKNRDGTFSTADANGVLLTGDQAKTVIPIGSANMEGSGDSAVFRFLNDDTGNILNVGQYFTMTDLVWDGEDYENFEAGSGDAGDQWTGTATMFNLTLLDNLDGAAADTTTGYVTKDSKQVYIITGVTEGRDGQRYLTIAPAINPGHSGTSISGDVIEGSKLYLASVARTGVGGTYSQTVPGTGPWGLIFPSTAGGSIGTASDMRCDPSVLLGAMHFYHIGNGVYVQVENEGDTTQMSSDPKYYFAGRLLSKKDLFGKNEGNLGELFPVQLAPGDKFNATFTEVGTTKVHRLTAQYDKQEGGEFTFDSLVKGANGQYYIYLGSSQAGYVGVGNEKFLTKVNATTGDVRTWAGAGGIGGPNDKTAKPDIFGTGTQADPFIITSRAEMNFISQQVAAGTTYAGIYFEVANDFDMSTTPFTPIGTRNKPFRGIFDGKDYTIDKLTTNTTNELQALFGWVDGTGVVKNVKLANVSVKGGANTASIAGYNAGLIENCTAQSGTVTVSGTAGGGIVGYNQGSVKGCISNVTMNTSGNNQGGIVGHNYGSASLVENCSFAGTINSNSNYVGGVVGYNQGKVTNCHNTGTILPTGGLYIGGVVGESYNVVSACTNKGVIGNTTLRRSHVGGIVGVNYHTIENCQNLVEGQVFGTQYVGGIVGLNNNKDNAKIIDCTNAAPINGNNTLVGGIVGANIGTVQNCQNGGTVNGAGNTGGVAGQNSANSKIIASSNTNSVTGTGANTGGLVGYNQFTVENSFNTGTVNGASTVGGLVGYHHGTSAMLKLSYNEANVSGTDKVGGAIGYMNWSKMQQTYSKGNISGTTNVGGLAGHLYDACPTTDCYAVGSVTATGANAGGVFGYVQPYSASYYSILTNIYHAGGAISANGAAGGIVGNYGSYTRMTNAVAAGTISSGTKGAIYSTAGGVAPANAYYNSASGATITAGGAGVALGSMNQAWWQSTAKFTSPNWEWNSGLSRPVLVGLPAK